VISQGRVGVGEFSYSAYVFLCFLPPYGVIIIIVILYYANMQQDSNIQYKHTQLKAQNAQNIIQSENKSSKISIYPYSIREHIPYRLFDNII